MYELPKLAIGPRVRKSPFYDASRRHGASVFTVYNHMFLPMAFEEDPEKDYWNVVNGVQLWDVGCERQVEVSGPDALRFAQLLTPRNLANCEVGQVMYAPMTAEDGGMVNDPPALRVAADRFWFSLADSDGLLWARGLAHNSGMDVEVCEPDVSPLQIQGPKCIDVMRDLLGGWIDELPFYRFRETELDGIPMVVARMGYSRERCFEMYLQDGSRGDELWRKVWAAGEPHGITAGAPSQMLRLEGGILSYLTDMNLQNNPYEIGLGWAVDLDQPDDFMGKEALRRIEAEGVKRRLVGAEIGGKPLKVLNEEPWPVSRNGAAAGELRSCVYSPRLKKNLAYVMMGIEHAGLGTEFDVETSTGARRGTVVKMPWMQRQK
jgi:glycine cleavage system aminomethyltransferase T